MSTDEPRNEALRDRLEEEILTGVFHPGDRLEEKALAERFGVSRTPIREALFQMAASGLVEHRPRRGTIVAELGPHRLVEMFEVMAELEAMSARLAARRATAENLAAIRAAHAACGAARAGAAEDGGALYYYSNETFHDAIRLAARHVFLLEQARALHRRLRPYRRLQLRALGRMEASHAEHDAIVLAIAAGEGARAGELMRGHIAIQGERFADLLASLEAAHGAPAARAART
ncbi:GntR family transcriptional regulator [Paroceanicella profunda]|uniref:GntR family transcriptional regulator n=1 Tax=Paroceanicella profunda TaxID=2579971 RepID=A0A5B8FH02_9RHOB|nr:GntR family transcriptional regulator [Paroceanicella profunda]QDL91438.1 GntR family transcriptional regulator [Paroceanicella profunda]